MFQLCQRGDCFCHRVIYCSHVNQGKKNLRIFMFFNHCKWEWKGPSRSGDSRYILLVWWISKITMIFQVELQYNHIIYKYHLYYKVSFQILCSDYMTTKWVHSHLNNCWAFYFALVLFNSPPISVFWTLAFYLWVFT